MPKQKTSATTASVLDTGSIPVASITVMTNLPWRYVCEKCNKTIEPGQEYVDHWRGNERKWVHTWSHAECNEDG